MEHLTEDLIDVLKEDDRLVIDGDLNRAKVEDLALNMDSLLLNLPFYSGIDKPTTQG